MMLKLMPFKRAHLYYLSLSRYFLLKKSIFFLGTCNSPVPNLCFFACASTKSPLLIRSIFTRYSHALIIYECFTIFWLCYLPASLSAFLVPACFAYFVTKWNSWSIKWLCLIIDVVFYLSRMLINCFCI